jgi:endonuclease/exonuclease/phosphatase family metal-dependent hydrolase
MRNFVLLILSLYSITLEAQSLKVMTYNIRYKNGGDGINNWCHRKKKVVNVIQRQQPDVLAVQEAMRSQMNYLSRKLSGYQYVGVGRNNGKKKGEYAALFYKKSRLKVENSGYFWLSETPNIPGSTGWDASCTRIATWAEYRDTVLQKSFVVLTTHLDHAGVNARVQSILAIKKWYSSLSVQKPTIICGDFNFQPFEEPYALFFDNETNWEEARPNDYNQGTFCGFKKDKTDCKTIDYVFHTSEWTVEQFEVLTDNDGTYYPSDHLPVVVTVRLKP